MEKLIEKLKELIAKEENIDVRIGLRLALLHATKEYVDQLNVQSLKQIKSN